MDITEAPDKIETQTTQIWELLDVGMEVTQEIARERCGCWRLAAVIDRLKKKQGKLIENLQYKRKVNYGIYVKAYPDPFGRKLANQMRIPRNRSSVVSAPATPPPVLPVPDQGVFYKPYRCLACGKPSILDSNKPVKCYHCESPDVKESAIHAS
jgi:hypothetical protein